MNSKSQNGEQTSSANHNGMGEILDPNVLKSAKEIYYTYLHFHVQLKRKPIGVAVDQKTHKGQLLFTKRPILLPDEKFVPISQLESHNN